MGLDMHLYQASRICDNVIDKFEGQDLDYLEKKYRTLRAFTDDFFRNDELGLYADLRPYTSRATVNVKKLHVTKFKRDNQIVEDAELVDVKKHGERVICTFSYCGGRDEAETAQSEIDSKYTLSVPTEMNFLFLKRLCSWRNKDELREKIHSVNKQVRGHREIENLGMYRVSELVWRVIRNGIALRADDEDAVANVDYLQFIDDDNDGLFYQESY